jgi:hypothetical protein
MVVALESKPTTTPDSPPDLKTVAYMHATSECCVTTDNSAYTNHRELVYRSAALAAVAAVRERCAAICDAAASPHNGYDSMGYSIPDPATALAAAIRSMK